MKNTIIQDIIENLVGDIEEWEVPKKFFRPIWIVRCGHTRYSVNKAIKRLKDEGYVNYISVGGGCNYDFEPTPPWTGYEFTIKGLKWLKKEYPELIDA